MYVLFLYIISTHAMTLVSGNETKGASMESRINYIDSKCKSQMVKMKEMRNELESLRFTVLLWSFVNVGLMIILIYTSWRTYKRQEKMSEWRL